MEPIKSQCGYPEGLTCSDVFIKVHDAKFINVECGNEFSLGQGSTAGLIVHDNFDQAGLHPVNWA